MLTFSDCDLMFQDLRTSDESLEAEHGWIIGQVAPQDGSSVVRQIKGQEFGSGAAQQRSVNTPLPKVGFEKRRCELIDISNFLVVEDRPVKQ